MPVLDGMRTSVAAEPKLQETGPLGRWWEAAPSCQSLGPMGQPSQAGYSELTAASPVPSRRISALANRDASGPDVRAFCHSASSAAPAPCYHSNADSPRCIRFACPPQADGARRPTIGIIRPTMHRETILSSQQTRSSSSQDRDLAGNLISHLISSMIRLEIKDVHGWDKPAQRCASSRAF